MLDSDTAVDGESAGKLAQREKSRTRSIREVN
jgi:hypothetical protein